MKRPYLNEFQRYLLKSHREGDSTINGAVIELDMAKNKLFREIEKSCYKLIKKWQHNIG